MTECKEVPSKPEHGYGGNSRTVESKSGFKVYWFNAVGTTSIQPGIYIRFSRPDGQMKEETFFLFRDKEAAQAKFDSHVEKLKEWGELE